MARKELPRQLDQAGAELFVELNEQFVFEPHERPLVEQLCHTLDTMTALESIVRRDGLTVRPGFDKTLRPHPLLAELRQQRAIYTRLIKALRLPVGEEAERAVLPARRTKLLRAVDRG